MNMVKNEFMGLKRFVYLCAALLKIFYIISLRA